MIFHEKLTVSKITRQSRLIEQVSTPSWERQVFPIRDPAVLEDTWREWAIHETVKRYLFVFFLRARAYEFSHVRSTAWFAWHTVTIKLIEFTSRYRRCSRRRTLFRVYHVTTNYGQQRHRLSGHSYSFALPLMVALRSGSVACR
jgi:hypothetical protein